MFVSICLLHSTIFSAICATFYLKPIHTKVLYLFLKVVTVYLLLVFGWLLQDFPLRVHSCSSS